ncbi:hypothetical protein PPYR_13607 [Photinus pyralis]|uniref:Uncharacterized protein n=1 Tax=Photinus pyralis TaxID=7054 RepID=A0A1Y1N6R4_PHOPY|nr:uncharacterized protein LOC116179106 [Photinus pyralis]XP_031354679.1 uncharacterized protein LOC116179106 [Photinus pyralis]KAB0793987.1 hypothetical protein PPYR_13607 [Photinus pyralis]
MEGFVKFLFVAVSFNQIFGETKYEISLDNNDLECIKELALVKEVVLSSFGENFKVDEGNRDNYEFMKCSFRKSGYITDNNHINVTGIRKWLSQWDLRDLHQELEVNNVKDLNVLIDECLKKCVVNEYFNEDEIALKTYNCLLDCLLWKRLY